MRSGLPHTSLWGKGGGCSISLSPERSSGRFRTGDSLRRAYRINHLQLNLYKNAIKKSLSEVLGVNTNNISIKGTTTNNLGFVDMSNGWGAQAILTIDDGN